MIPITYMRSSSLGTWDWCQNKYLLAYCLGLKDKPNLKAWMGTTTHRALETLGSVKIARGKGLDRLKDELFDHSLEELEDLELINNICFDYYAEHEKELSPGEKERKTCLKWFRKALAFRGGIMDPRNQNVFATEVFFDLDLPEWAEYDYQIGPNKFVGRGKIKGTVDLVISEGEGYFQILDYKGLPVETPLPTPDGWTTMGDVEVGELVFDQYGQPTKVVAKSTQKLKECYEITFDDTSKAVCDYEHYWKLSNHDVVQIEDLKVGDKIGVPKSILCEEKELPIDPYVLGVWLGDGRNRTGEITSGDKFVFDEIERRGFSLGKNMDNTDSKGEARTILGLRTKLRLNNFLHNKHIPEIYLRASYEQRLDLLRGLMDSDGSANKTRKQCVFMNCREVLSRDTKKLLLSLGQRPLVSRTTAPYFSESQGKELEIVSFPVSFRPIDINPFLLPVKRDKVDPEWGSGRSHIRTITDIEKVGVKLTQCISVDSPDKTYLCTENMIPTHNTGQRLNWATGEIKTQEDFEKDPQLLLYYYALRNIYPDHKFFMSIYYINHGGPKHPDEGGVFSVAFDDSDYEKAENMLKEKFEAIRGTNVPSLLSPSNSHWKCKYLCKFSEQSAYDPNKTTCQFLNGNIRDNGIEDTLLKYGDVNKLDSYGTGGGKVEKG